MKNFHIKIMLSVMVFALLAGCSKNYEERLIATRWKQQTPVHIGKAFCTFEGVYAYGTEHDISYSGAIRVQVKPNQVYIYTVEGVGTWSVKKNLLIHDWTIFEITKLQFNNKVYSEWALLDLPEKLDITKALTRPYRYDIKKFTDKRMELTDSKDILDFQRVL
jgi:hypothetical protein